ncbi:MAG TPA: hypothetical protein VF808_07400 [Ktedonobacterales bacterium]
MPTRQTLALYAYTPPSSQYPLIISELGAQVEELEFTTVAPGGFGDLACGLRLDNPRIPRPDLGIFSRVILRDDPDDAAYAAPATAQSILAAELARRAAYLPLDQDTSAILPDAPAATFAPVYDGTNLEEILHDLMGALGDYTWTVYDHPAHTDAAGYPTWQLQAHQRDLATTTYLALGEDIAGWRVTPSAERAYNATQVAYVDPATGPGVITASDPRLNSDGSQGTAPFRRRKLRRSLGVLPVTAAQASAIAQAWLAAYSQPTNKVEMVLRAVRDANGAPIPLSHVRADANLFAPELATRGQTLSTGPQPGVNQFYIVETRYHEAASGDITLTLQLDNYADRVEGLLARLRLTDDARRRRRGVYRLTQSPGAQQMGFAAIRAPSASAGQTAGASVSFVPTLSKTPTALTFSQISATNVGSGPTVTAGSLTLWGCEITVTAAATGGVAWSGTWTTVGA